jgi:Sulfotransferase family
MAPPILVTGSHRSGTTWVGKMLARTPGVAYVHEPFNPQRGPGWVGERLPHWYLYVCPENEGPYLPLFRGVMELRYPIGRDLASLGRPRFLGQALLEWGRSAPHRARGDRPLVKDPIALFSAEWVASRFGAKPVVMIRHPAAFAGSLKRLNWRFDFANWADQPLLLRDHLAPFEREIRDFTRSSAGRDIIDQAVLLWNGIHHTIRGYRDRHEDWIFVRYEDLAADPVPGYLDLFARLDLPWSEGIRAEIERFSTGPEEVSPLMHRRVKRNSRAAARTWVHRLTERERQRIRDGTSEVAGAFYGDEHWALGERSGGPVRPEIGGQEAQR